MPQTFAIPAWPYAYGGPCGQGVIRSIPEDFVVRENLAFEPSGTGEHAFLQLQKSGENTEYVARQLARFVGVRQRDVGYAGLKDRHALTTQWFSVWLPGKPDPDWQGFASETITVLQAIRHTRKLKRGVLSGNDFELSIRDWQGDKVRLAEQLAAIKSGGIANYFGAQRFGLHGQNVNKALALFQGMRVKREQRSLYLSAARAYLFNQVLAQRVTLQNWNVPVAGDALIFDGGRGYFKADTIDAATAARVAALDIHPSGVLWGSGVTDVSAAALAIEADVIGRFEALAQGLIASGMSAERRALRVRVRNLAWHFSADDELKLRFALPAGSYATALLREIIEL
ncbi:MAG: tRNA pseudouridine(13) synthase TruD [Gammaproteobacteria bacterium HGW-Gammaproteobacteria-3]|nr:MAG: tRNA pseudouridine(13) synthase TruD [Gammaproteobacteria bacterium HGW-Gammaproteobacteria-3]